MRFQQLAVIIKNMNPTTPGKRVLLVEDDELIRELYQSELTNAGLEVDAFANGNSALEALKTKQYDLALLDIMLPDTNGLTILKHIKETLQTKNLKVVLLTNLGQESVIKEGFALGAAGYLIKVSLNPDQVIKEVQKFLEPEQSTIPTPAA